MGTSPGFHRLKEHGFSLVELSIVLVILGLLTGGILGGQALIKAAQLRSISADYNQYQVAINTFRSKYFAFPGDMPNATQFWGRADNGTFSGQCASPDSNTGTGTQTCNGDGNGVINSNTEIFRFWQHLANAGLINGDFTGVAGSGGAQHHIIGENCPVAKYGDGVGWAVREVMDNYTGTGSLWTQYPSGNLMRLGRESTNSFLGGSAFAPEDAWNIDTKVDDGKPGQGLIWARAWQDCTTATAGDQQDTAEYNLSNSSQDCMLFFYLK
jgi:prepilin-type N-terminal cleavage/methylation domain-containing protein